MKERIQIKERNSLKNIFFHSIRIGAAFLALEGLSGCSSLSEENPPFPASSVTSSVTPSATATKTRFVVPSVTRSLTPSQTPEQREQEKAVLEFTQENFTKEVVQSEIPVLAILWSRQCGYCLKLDPIIEELAEEYQGKIKIGRVDVDKSSPLAQKLAQQFQLRYTPTLIFFKEGEVESLLIGAHPEETIKQNLDHLLELP